MCPPFRVTVQAPVASSYAVRMRSPEWLRRQTAQHHERPLSSTQILSPPPLVLGRRIIPKRELRTAVSFQSHGGHHRREPPAKQCTRLCGGRLAEPGRPASAPPRRRSKEPHEGNAAKTTSKWNDFGLDRS